MEYLTFHTKPRFGLLDPNCWRLQLASTRYFGGNDCDYYEHSWYVIVSFVLRVSVISECSQCDIKLAHDTLKELDEFNSCEYICKVVTHLIEYL